jgi:signal transduction histidine kinase
MSKEVRTISHLLHRPLLDEAGLASAIRWYIDGFVQRSHINDLDCPEDFGRLPRDLEIAMFRVVQECLTHIHRHSGSQVANIRCQVPNNHAFVEVADRGTGISPERLAHHGIGGYARGHSWDERKAPAAWWRFGGHLGSEEAQL